MVIFIMGQNRAGESHCALTRETKRTSSLDALVARAPRRHAANVRLINASAANSFSENTF